MEIKRSRLIPSFLLYGIVGILTAGLVLEMYFVWGVEDWFARSGSVLVCYSIGCVYSNHFMRDRLANSKSRYESWKSAPTDTVGVLAYLKRLNPNNQSLTEELAAPLAKTFAEMKVSNKEEEKYLKNTSRIIVKYEIGAAILGTFAWGFGDLFYVQLFFVFVLILVCMLRSTPSADHLFDG